jgi:hypothetical protein
MASTSISRICLWRCAVGTPKSGLSSTVSGSNQLSLADFKLYFNFLETVCGVEPLKQKGGYPPLASAAGAGRVDIMQFLVDEKRVDVNEAVASGASSLNVAVTGFTSAPAWSGSVYSFPWVSIFDVAVISVIWPLLRWLRASATYF